MVKIMALFWSNLTEDEAERYQHLSKIVQIWAGWCALKKKEQEQTPKPYEPTDDQFLQCELLAMHGWNVA